MKTIKERIQYLLRKKPTVVYVKENEEEITDEIIKSLWEIKDVYDLDTEEVSKSVSGYVGRVKKRE
jgi:translation elongation factor EF-1beta